MRKSTSTDLTLVWPDLKSSPPTKTRRCWASSSAPGTSVFCGDPLRKAQPSKMLATAKRVEGDTSRPSCGHRRGISREGSFGTGPDPSLQPWVHPPGWSAAGSQRCH